MVSSHTSRNHTTILLILAQHYFHSQLLLEVGTERETLFLLQSEFFYKWNSVIDQQPKQSLPDGGKKKLNKNIRSLLTVQNNNYIFILFIYKWPKHTTPECSVTATPGWILFLLPISHFINHLTWRWSEGGFSAELMYKV